MYILVGASIYFACVDLFSHRIGNRSLLITIAFLLSFQLPREPIHPYSALLILILGIFLFMRFGLGGGDVKYSTVLAFFYLPFSHQAFTRYLMGLSIGIILLSVAYLLRLRSLPTRIPLAPAISLGTILGA